MRNLTMTALAALALGLAGAANASESRRDAPAAHDDGARPEAIQSQLEEMGYRVTRIESEHGRYEVRAVNDSNYPVKLKFDRATGELVRAKLKD